MKHITFFLKSMLLALMLMSAGNVSAYDFVSGGIYYSVNSIGATVENKGSFNTYTGNVTIPSSVTYGGSTYSVVSIGYQAFKGSTGLTSVTLPNTIMYLANEAFHGCTSLTSINLPSSITAIYNNVFVNCSGLTSVYCNWDTPKQFNVNNFSSSTYSSATLYVPAGKVSAYSSVAPWSSFTTIKEAPVEFTYNGITYFPTGDNTVKVVKKASGNYSGSITVPSSVPYNGKTYSVTAIGEGAFRYATGLTSVSLPNTIVNMEYAAFSDCGLTSITIPNSVTSVDFSVFMDCASLKTVNIGSGLKKLTAFMFIRCTALETITIPNTVTEISYEVFQDCSKLKTVDIGSGVTSIDRYTFTGCSLLEKVICRAIVPPTLHSLAFDSGHYSNATLVVPPSAESAYKSASNWKNFTSISTLLYDFYVNGIYYKKIASNKVQVACEDPINNTYTGNVNIPSSITVNGVTFSVTGIGEYAFYMCKNLTGVSMPNTITVIGECAFEKCSGLTSVTIPNSVTTLGLDAFSSCTALKKIEIPNSVTNIGQLAFYNCSSMTEVTIGSGVTSIGQQAFANCGALTKVTCLAVNPPTMQNSNCFGASTYSSAKLYVPGASSSAYKSADWWRMFVTINSLPFDFCVDGIYYKKTSISSVEVTYKDYEYNSYSGTVTIPYKITVNGSTYMVTAIGDNAFYKSTGLTGVSMPFSVTKIGAYGFCNTGIQNMVIGSGVKTIGQQAFSSCTALKNVTIPEGVTDISVQAFQYCTALTEVTIPNSVTQINTNAFDQCSKLKTVVLGTGLKTLGSSAFAYCNALTSVTSMAKVPPTMGSSNCFSSTAYGNATLYVAESSLNAYKSADWWRMFTTIVAGDFGGDPCDMNGDGEVNIADVNALTNAILLNSHDLNYDANGDGEVNIADINFVIDAILAN